MLYHSLVRRVTIVAAIVVVAAASAGGAETSEAVAHEVTSGLRWYFHWQESLPQVGRLTCRGEGFRENYFIYCYPARVTVDMTSEAGSPARINVITTTNDDLQTSFHLFGVHQTAPSTGGFFFPVDADKIAAYETDRELSRERMNATGGYMRKSMRVYEERGRHVRCLFPLVARGDPFYEVYLVEGTRLDSVWLFPVVGNKVQDYSSWVYDRPHDNIPETAPSHVGDPSRWYAILTSSAGK